MNEYNRIYRHRISNQRTGGHAAQPTTRSIAQPPLNLLHIRLFDAPHQPRVVAHFTQLHLNIHELGQVPPLDCLHEEAVIVLEDGSVVLLLRVGELDVDDGFLFGGNVLGDV